MENKELEKPVRNLCKKCDSKVFYYRLRTNTYICRRCGFVWTAKSKIFSLVILMIFLSSPAFANIEYNSRENRYETVPEGWEIKYNSREDYYSYQPEWSELEYNSREGKYEWTSGANPGKGNSRYNN